MKALRAIIHCLLALAPFGASHAASCMVLPGDLDMGDYSAFSAVALDGAGPVRVSCTSDTGSSESVPYSISISGSNKTLGGNMVPRMLTGPGQPMEYNLYIDASRSVVWGDGSNGTESVSGTIAVQAMGSSTAMHTVYGRIPAQQPGIAPGRYSDALIISVAY